MKTFLLGSAAVLGVGGAAQAADLAPVYAEPVDYVRVCDAFGAGYYYIPGTDTCLRIGGYVRFTVEFSEDVYDHYDDEEGRTEYSDWRFRTKAGLDITAQSMTDWGPLIGYLEAEFEFRGDAASDAEWVNGQNAFLSLGPWMAGVYQSNFDTGGSYTSIYQLDNGFGYGFTDDKVLQMQLSWAFNGFGIILAAEDPNTRGLDGWEDSSQQGDIPDLVAALTGEWGDINAKVAFLYRDTDPDNTWGVQGNVGFNDLFGGLDVILAGFWIDKGSNECNGATIVCGSGDTWGAQGTLRYDWTPTFRTAATFQYIDYSSVNGNEGWRGALEAQFRPVDDFLFAIGGFYDDAGDDSGVQLRFQRSFGG